MSHLPEARRRVRLAIVNADGELLLCQQGKRPDRWSTVGGMLDPDEDFPAAAQRILDEAVGLDCPLGPLLREREGSDDGPWCERYFLVRCPSLTDVELNRQSSGNQEESQAARTAYRWWPLAEIYKATDDETFEPAWLPELLASILTSEPPSRSPLPPRV